LSETQPTNESKSLWEKVELICAEVSGTHSSMDVRSFFRRSRGREICPNARALHRLEQRARPNLATRLSSRCGCRNAAAANTKANFRHAPEGFRNANGHLRRCGELPGQSSPVPRAGW